MSPPVGNVRAAAADVGIVLVAVAVLLISACSSAAQRAAANDCTLAEEDAPLAAAAPLYLECSVDRPARVVAPVPIDYRPATPPLRGSECLMAEVQFVVGPTGHPEAGTVRVLRTTDGRFAEAVAARSLLWRYEPALLNGVPVRQLVRERHARAIVAIVVPSGQSPTRPPPAPDCR